MLHLRIFKPVQCKVLPSSSIEFFGNPVSKVLPSNFRLVSSIEFFGMSTINCNCCNVFSLCEIGSFVRMISYLVWQKALILNIHNENNLYQLLIVLNVFLLKVYDR